MINRERTWQSVLSANSNNWLSRTSQSNYILNHIYHAMKWFCIGDHIIIDSV